MVGFGRWKEWRACVQDNVCDCPSCWIRFELDLPISWKDMLDCSCVELADTICLQQWDWPYLSLSAALGLVFIQQLHLGNPCLMPKAVFMGMFQLDTFPITAISMDVGRVLLQVICWANWCHAAASPVSPWAIQLAPWIGGDSWLRIWVPRVGRTWGYWFPSGRELHWSACADLHGYTQRLTIKSRKNEKFWYSAMRQKRSDLI